jgi:hypothetical protein
MFNAPELYNAPDIHTGEVVNVMDTSIELRSRLSPISFVLRQIQSEKEYANAMKKRFSEYAEACDEKERALRDTLKVEMEQNHITRAFNEEVFISLVTRNKSIPPEVIQDDWKRFEVKLVVGHEDLELLNADFRHAIQTVKDAKPEIPAEALLWVESTHVMIKQTV